MPRVLFFLSLIKCVFFKLLSQMSSFPDVSTCKAETAATKHRAMQKKYWQNPSNLLQAHIYPLISHKDFFLTYAESGQTYSNLTQTISSLKNSLIKVKSMDGGSVSALLAS